MQSVIFSADLIQNYFNYFKHDSRTKEKFNSYFFNVKRYFKHCLIKVKIDHNFVNLLVIKAFLDSYQKKLKLLKSKRTC